jgi:DNA-binding PadR family transcriptional regulator
MMMTKKPTRIMKALGVLSGSPDGMTEHFFEIVHGVHSDTLETLVKGGFATVDVERTKQGIEIARYHITDAGRRLLEEK